MAPLTWRNVNAPDLNSSARTIQTAGNSLSDGFSGLSDTLGVVRDRQKDRRSMPIIDQLLAASTEEEAEAALAGVSGGIANRDRSDGLLTAMNQLRGVNLDYEDSRATTDHRLQQTSNLRDANGRANANAGRAATDREEQEARDAAGLNMAIQARALGDGDGATEASFTDLTTGSGGVDLPAPKAQTPSVPTPTSDTLDFSTPTSQPSADRNKTLRPTGKAGEEDKDVPTPRNFEPGTETLGFGSAVDDVILRSGVNLGPEEIARSPSAPTSVAPNDGRIVPPTPLTTRDDVSEADLASAATTTGGSGSANIDAMIQPYIDSGVIKTADDYNQAYEMFEAGQTSAEAEETKAEDENNASYIENLASNVSSNSEADLVDQIQEIRGLDISEERKQTLRTLLDENRANNADRYGGGTGVVSQEQVQTALGDNVDPESISQLSETQIAEARAVADDLVNGGTLGDTGLTDDMRAAVSQEGDVQEQEYPSNQADFMVYFNDNFNSSEMELVDFDKTTGQLQSLQTQTGVPMSLLVPLTRNSFGDPSSFNGKAGLDMDAMMRQLAPLLSDVTDENGSVTNRYSEAAYLELRAKQRAVEGHSTRSDEAFAEYNSAGQAMSDLLAQSDGATTPQNKQELNQLAQQRVDAGRRIQEATDNLRTAAGLPTTQEAADTKAAELAAEQEAADVEQEQFDADTRAKFIADRVAAGEQIVEDQEHETRINQLMDRSSPDLTEGPLRQGDDSDIRGESPSGNPSQRSYPPTTNQAQVALERATIPRVQPSPTSQINQALGQVTAQFNERSGSPIRIPSSATSRSPARPGNSDNQDANRFYDLLVNQDLKAMSSSEELTEALTSDVISREELNRIVQDFQDNYGGGAIEFVVRQADQSR